jgi:Lon protease-like protein
VPEETVREFPLFLLPTVALPEELIPLHVFEERYKTMVEECIQHERPFGILWLSDDGLREVGCAVVIQRVLERFDDGRMNVLVRGTRPFRVVERQSHLAYPAAVVEFLEDRVEQPEAQLLEGAHADYKELVERATDRTPDDAELCEMGAYAMAATVDFGLDAKQGLLDLRSEKARLRLVRRLFRAAMKRLDLVEHAHERARSNGKVRFGGA